MLLHPATLFLIVWGVALGAWALLSQEWFIRVVHAEKHVSLRSSAFFLSSVAAFAIGSVIGPSLLKVDRHAALVSVRNLVGAQADGVARKLKVLAALGALCALYVLVVGTMRFGGPGVLWSYVRGGGSWIPLSLHYFRPARLPGISVWFHLLVAVGPIATVLIMRTEDRWERRKLQLLHFASFGLILLLSFALAERLVAFGYIVASVVAWLGVRPHLDRPGSRTRMLIKIGAGFAVLVALWGANEFSRTYLAQRGDSTPVRVDDVSSSVSDRFAAYIIGSVNTGMYAVDEQESIGYVGFLGSAVITALNLDTPDSPILGPVLVEQERMIEDVYVFGDPLTTFSMPAMVYSDVRWVGILVVFWFGVLAGCAYMRFCVGELWALLVYPGVVVGIFDSTRILYWTRTEMIVPLVAFAIVCVPLYRARKPVVLATQKPAVGGPR